MTIQVEALCNLGRHYLTSYWPSSLLFQRILVEFIYCIYHLCYCCCFYFSDNLNYWANTLYRDFACSLGFLWISKPIWVGLKRGKGGTFTFSIRHYIPLNLDGLIDAGGNWFISCNLILINNPSKFF